jgi:hypothetical protein
LQMRCEDGQLETAAIGGRSQDHCAHTTSQQTFPTKHHTHTHTHDTHHTHHTHNTHSFRPRTGTPEHALARHLVLADSIGVAHEFGVGKRVAAGNDLPRVETVRTRIAVRHDPWIDRLLCSERQLRTRTTAHAHTHTHTHLFLRRWDRLRGRLRPRGGSGAACLGPRRPSRVSLASGRSSGPASAPG